MADCWLERWREQGIKEGTRARDRLRDGVEQALDALGTGFLAANPSLQESLARGDRGWRHLGQRPASRTSAARLPAGFPVRRRGPGPAARPRVSAESSRRYDDYFSTRRLRQIAGHRAGDRHTDLWRTLVVVLNSLGADGGCPEIGLPPLGGLYFRGGTPNGENGPARDLLRDCELRNADLLEAIRYLATFRDKRGYRQNVDFRHLGAEELGSVYESLLELVPATEPGPRFVLRAVSGNERKTTGSYYTPTPLVEELLNSALDPLIEEAAASDDPDDLLKITSVRPGLRFRAFPHRRRPPDRETVRGYAARRRRAHPRASPAGHAEGRRLLHLWRGHQAARGRAGQSIALAGIPGAGPSTGVPRCAHQGR